MKSVAAILLIRGAPGVAAAKISAGSGPSARVGIEVRDPAAGLVVTVAVVAQRASGRPVVTMRSSTRAVMPRDPVVGEFVPLFEQPAPSLH
jgi:hypothetical protein